MGEEKPKRAAELSVRDARIAAYQTAILDAAELLFSQTGFESAKMEDLARMAGVAKGTLYNYFANKEAVFSALADRCRDQMLEAVDQALAAAPLEDRPRAFVHGLFEFIERSARMAVVYMHTTGLSMTPPLDPHAPEGRKILTERLRESLRPLYESGRIRTDISLEWLVLLLGGLLGAAIGDFLERDQQASLTEATTPIMSLFFEGAGPR